MSSTVRRRRDRRGRGVRGPLAWPRIPAMVTPTQVFDAAVLEAWDAIERRHGVPLENLEIAVETVPPSDPAPWEFRVALGRVFPAQGDLPARVVLYRRPIETRAGVEAPLSALVHQVLAEQIASVLGKDPEDLV